MSAAPPARDAGRSPRTPGRLHRAYLAYWNAHPDDPAAVYHLRRLGALAGVLAARRRRRGVHPRVRIPAPRRAR